MKKFIFLFLSLLLPIAAMAAYTNGTINITVGSNTYAAKAQIDHENLVVLVGNGYNACVPHYAEGPLAIPGTYSIQGNDYTVNIAPYAFRLCNGITQVTIGEGTTKIGDCAFSGCANIEEVDLPSTLTMVGRAAFAGLKSLKIMVSDATTAPQWGYNDVFHYYGFKQCMRNDAQNRVLYVPSFAVDSYNNTNYADSIGWKDAFARIYERDFRPVTINSKAELKTFREKVNDGTATQYYGGVNSFELTADIEWDLETDGKWTPIGTVDHPFYGSFDGKGHKISGLQNAQAYVLTPSAAEHAYVGFFGYASNAYIHNFYLENPRFISKDYAGCVLGYSANYTRVSDVLVISDAGSQQYTLYALGSGGGIVGFVKSGVIERCYFQGRVWSHLGWAGGIVGHIQNGRVEDCAAGSYVANIATSDNWRLGGIVGGTYGSYTSGEVNVTINRCLAWSNFIIDGNPLPGDLSYYSGWILGYANVPTEITNCAFYVDPNKRNYKIYGACRPEIEVSCSNNASSGDNATYTTFNSLKGHNTVQYLGDDNWYYFTEGYENYPVPNNLRVLYMSNLVYDMDEFGVNYQPVHNANNEIIAYKVKGYEGFGTSDIMIPNEYKGKPVTEIMPHAFEGKTFDTGTDISIGNNVTVIGDSAFMKSNINQVLIGSGGLSQLHTIGVSAFEDCDEYELAVLPASLTTIRKRAFRGCDKLNTFSIGANFANHEDNFLAYCPKLNGIYVNNNPNFKAINNRLLVHKDDGNNRSYIITCAQDMKGDLVLPVDELGDEIIFYDNAFNSCTKLTGITIPGSTDKSYSMGKGVFYDCNHLRFLDMRGVQCIDTENDQPLPWVVERNDPNNPFYGMNERTIIWTDATSTCEVSEKNVVRGDQANSIILTDGWDFEAKTTFTASNVTMDRGLIANVEREEYFDETGQLITNTYNEATGYTVCLPYPLTLSGDNVKVYEPHNTLNLDYNTIVTFYEVEDGVMEAYKPYYVVVSSDDVSLDCDEQVTITIKPTDTEDWEDLGYIFSGTTVTIPNSELRTMGAYILQSDNIWHKVPANQELEDVYVGPFRSYFHTVATNTSPAPMLLSQFVENGSTPTDIEAIRTVDSNGDERYFDLQGRQLPGKPEKGIYIHNGKKYIAK